MTTISLPTKTLIAFGEACCKMSSFISASYNIIDAAAIVLTALSVINSGSPVSAPTKRARVLS